MFNDQSISYKALHNLAPADLSSLPSKLPNISARQQALSHFHTIACFGDVAWNVRSPFPPSEFLHLSEATILPAL